MHRQPFLICAVAVACSGSIRMTTGRYLAISERKSTHNDSCLTLTQLKHTRNCAEITPKPLFTATPVPLTPEGLVKAVRFYEQVKRENPPVETGAWKDAVDWVLKEACCAVILGKADNPLASSNQVGELTMLVKRLVSQLKKANPDCKLPEMAMDYLKRNELISVEDILR